MEGGSSGGSGVAKSQLTSSGGMRQTFGGGLNEAHLDEAATVSSSQTKQQNQQSSVLGQQGAGKQVAQNQNAGQNPLAQTPEAPAVEPRAVDSLTSELLTRPVKDIADNLGKFVNINSLLNIKTKTPEEETKQKQVADRWQKLTAAEQEVAKQKYQENLQKKRQAEEEAAEKKRQEEEQKEAELPMPQGKQTGYRGVGGMSGKKKAQTLVQQQRTTMGGAE